MTDPGPVADVTVREARPAERVAVRGVLDAAMLEPGDVTGAIEREDVLVAVADGNIVGALVLDPREGGARVESVAVRRARRGQGIGTALVEAAAARAGRLTADFDPDVRPFYESLGFEIEPTDVDRLRGTIG
jgi:GNAT superfamily N-acetyltransferase